MNVSLPRARGCTGAGVLLAVLVVVSSPRAGVYRAQSNICKSPWRLFPARGGGPFVGGWGNYDPESLPRTRGCTGLPAGRVYRSPVSSPHAGVDRFPAVCRLGAASLFPVRGGGPMLNLVLCTRSWSLPRTRGWTELLPRGQEGRHVSFPRAGVYRFASSVMQRTPRLFPACGGDFCATDG